MNFFKGENDRGRLYYNGLIDLLNKILNKLKKVICQYQQK